VSSGTNADPVAPWYVDPWGLGGAPVPLNNYDELGPASLPHYDPQWPATVNWDQLGPASWPASVGSGIGRRYA
jgi:hypothetical protein